MPSIRKTTTTAVEQQYFDGQTFDDVDYTEQPPPTGEYENCLFTGCDFSEADLTDMVFVDTEFIDCNLSNARLNNTTFQDTLFRNCKLLGLHFEKCNEFGFSPSFEDCQLNHSSFYGMKLRGINFSGSQMQGVDFTGADLKNAAMNECDLLNAAFDNTNLEKADLRNSVNYSIDPELNRVKGATFSLPEVVGLLDKYGIHIKPKK